VTALQTSTPTGRLRHRAGLGPSVSTRWGLLAWLIAPVVFIVKLGAVDEPDVYWHVRMGADILENRRFTGDPGWTFGPIQPGWATTQAASEIVLNWIYGALSWEGLSLLRSAGAAALVVSLLIASSVPLRGRSARVTARAVAIVTLTVIAGVGPVLAERPQALSLVLLPWIGLLAMRVMYADRWPAWWWVGLLVMVWSWFHGAAVMVWPVLILAAVARAVGSGGLRWLPVLAASLRKGWAVILVAMVAPLIGPLGFTYYLQTLMIKDAATDRIAEWLAATTDSATVIFALVLLILWGLSVVRITSRVSGVWRTIRMDGVFLGALLILELSAARYLLVSMLLAAPLVARRLAQAFPGAKSQGDQPAERGVRSRKTFGVVAIGCAWLLAALVAVVTVPGTRAVGPTYPLRIWQGLSQASPDHRVLVDYELGGQAQLIAGVVVSIDGRVDRYGGAVVDDYTTLVNGEPGWSAVMANYASATDVVLRKDKGLVDRLLASGWSQACADRDYVWLTAPGTSGGCLAEGDR
jgi:hypothetical protein